MSAVFSSSSKRLHQPKSVAKSGSDQLQHFSGDGPLVRLFALFVIRLPNIIYACATLVGTAGVGVGRWNGWW